MSNLYYEQGCRDAEQGEFNQLFYHTYHDYKRGYDETVRGKKRRRIPTLVWIVPVLLIGLGLGWLLRDRGILGKAPTPVTILVTPTIAPPSPTFPPFIIATAAPATPTSPATTLQPGIKAVVATDGGTLRIRPEANLQGEPIGRLTNGTPVTIVDGPREGDGYTWWQIEAEGIKGWVVADFLRVSP